jgi:anti-sigma B factor antagonist
LELIENVSGSVNIIRLSGRLDAYSATDVEKKLDVLINDGKVNMVVNLEGLEYISSSGLRVFLAGLKKVRKVRGDIKLACMKPYIREVFDIAGFTQLFNIEDSENDAVGRFSAGEQ